MTQCLSVCLGSEPAVTRLYEYGDEVSGHVLSLCAEPVVTQCLSVCLGSEQAVTSLYEYGDEVSGHVLSL